MAPRFAPLRSAPLRFASLRFAEQRFAALRFAPLRFAEQRFAALRFAPLRSASPIFALPRSGRMSGFSSRQAFQAATPFLSNATCSSFAIGSPAPWIQPQSSSASRLTAGAAGFFILSQPGERPER